MQNLKCVFSLLALQAQCANFEYMLWFESLLFYGFEENTILQKGDGDIGLLPAIVERVIVSKLTGREMYSTSLGTLRKISLCKICVMYLCFV